MLTRRLLLALASASTLVVLGCRESKISSYRVRKEAPPPQTLAAPSGGAAAPQLHWKTPAGWQEQPAGNVRIASFLVTEGDRKADISVTQFPGDVGGDLANINRWRGQIQLQPVAENELGQVVKPLSLPTGEFLTADLLSDKPILDGKYRARILGAWLKQPDRTWFFKIAGEADLVAAQRQAFEAFLRSLEFAAADPNATTAGMPDLSMPAGPAAAPMAPFAAGAGRTLTWKAPETWTAKPLGPTRKGSFSLPGVDGATADLSITSFPGEAGGMTANLNRWRQQLKLPQLSPAELASSSSTIATGGLRFTVVDYVGTATDGGPTRLVGAVLPLENETYFFKLTGPDAVVTQHKAAFLDFLKTVKAP